MGTQGGKDEQIIQNVVKKEAKKMCVYYSDNLTSATRYYYSETEPALNAEGTAYDGNFWHYDTDGITPVIWKKEN